MNAVAEVRSALIPALSMDEGELVTVLQTSLYPGAALSSIKLALGYCRASGLDPMQKPVHIVPMYDRESGKMRDVIMPGIGLYRTQAARSGQMAGITEPEFGPMVNYTLDKVDVSVPEWCSVTVKRREGGIVADYTAKEYWIENYAIKGGKEKSIAPNAMWTKRPRGQLAKCAQAQALRMAFPEMTGAAPTADEMEGRELDMGAATEVRPAQAERVGLPVYTEEEFAGFLPTWRAKIAGGTDAKRLVAMLSTKRTLSEAQVAEILKPVDEVMAEQAAAAEEVVA